MIKKLLLKLFPHFTIDGPDREPYMTRFYLWRCDSFNIYIHHLMRNDMDDFHDHPWAFVSLILKGGYIEVTPNNIPDGLAQELIYLRTKWKRTNSDTWEVIRPFRLVFHRAEDAHKLILRNTRQRGPKPCWSFVITGPKRRSWGFHVDPLATKFFGYQPGRYGLNFIPWRDYMDRKFGKNNWVSDKLNRDPYKARQSAPVDKNDEPM
jgi:hypothetical protein